MAVSVRKVALAYREREDAPLVQGNACVVAFRNFFIIVTAVRKQHDDPTSTMTQAEKQKTAVSLSVACQRRAGGNTTSVVAIFALPSAGWCFLAETLARPRRRGDPSWKAE